MDWPHEEAPLVMGLVVGALMRGTAMGFFEDLQITIDDRGDYTNVIDLRTKAHAYKVTLEAADSLTFSDWLFNSQQPPGT